MILYGTISIMGNHVERKMLTSKYSLGWCIKGNWRLKLNVNNKYCETY